MSEQIAGNITRGQLATELDKPGDCYVGALVAEDVVHVRAVKSTMREEFCIGSPDEEMGWSASRLDDGTLWLDVAR
jgi:hypothetical protein